MVSFPLLEFIDNIVDRIVRSRNKNAFRSELTRRAYFLTKNERVDTTRTLLKKII
jgi:hypothetical protein